MSDGFEFVLSGKEENKQFLKILNDIVSSTNTLKKEMKSLGDTQNKINKIVNGSNFKTTFKAGTNSVKELSDSGTILANVFDKGLTNVGNLFSHIGSESGKMFKAILSGSVTASEGVAALAASLGPITLLAGGIAVAAFMMKKAWDTNMGGIQKETSKFFAMVHKDWAQYNADLNKNMADNKGFFSTLIKGFSIGITSAYILIKALWKILKVMDPLTWVMKGLGEIMDKIFGSQEERMKKQEENWNKLLQGADTFYKILDDINNMTPSDVFKKIFGIETNDNTDKEYSDNINNNNVQNIQNVVDNSVLNYNVQNNQTEHAQVAGWFKRATNGM